jgi:hypothetical protein
MTVGMETSDGEGFQQRLRKESVTIFMSNMKSRLTWERRKEEIYYIGWRDMLMALFLEFLLKLRGMMIWQTTG